MKIGIFGGSFNPPHQMHKDIAINLINKGYLDQVIYVPTGNCYQKEGLIDSQYRYEMLKIMTSDNPNLLVSDVEMQSSLMYTYETLDYFRELFPNDSIYFICGSDNLDQITTWKNYQYILNNYQLLVIKRNCYQINSRFKNVVEANIPMSNISSTLVRNTLKNNEDKKYLDSKVREYIKNKSLYGM